MEPLADRLLIKPREEEKVSLRKLQSRMSYCLLAEGYCRNKTYNVTFTLVYVL